MDIEQTKAINMTDSIDVYDAIVAADEKFMSTFSQGDAQGIAALYTEKGQFLPPNGDFVMGREAIQATFQAFMDMGIKVIKLEALEVEGYGDTASEVGRYILEGEGGKVLDKGKFLVIWKKEVGQWKLHRDMINTSMPAPE
ncbi:YybH family protein, partial [Photobacterium profundum]